MPLIIKETPPAIVEEGYLHTGAFRLPFRRMNLMDAAALGGPLRRIRVYGEELSGRHFLLWRSAQPSGGTRRASSVVTP